MKYTSTLIIVALVASFAPAALASPEDQPKMVPPKPKVEKKAPQGEVAPKIEPVQAADYRGLVVSLTVGKAEYQFGESVAVQTTLKCVGGPMKLFNPFFDASAERPGRIRIFDGSGKIVAELFGEEQAAQSTNQPWVQAPRGGMVGASLMLRPEKDLRPGNYRAQLVLTETLESGARSEVIVAASAPVSFKVVGASATTDH